MGLYSLLKTCQTFMDEKAQFSSYKVRIRTTKNCSVTRRHERVHNSAN